PLRWLRALGPKDEDAGRYPGAVKEIGAEPDHDLQEVVPDKAVADLLLLTTPEQDAVGHDRNNHATRPEDGQHVLDEHEIGLLAALRAKAIVKPLLELHPGSRIVLTEWR